MKWNHTILLFAALCAGVVALIVLQPDSANTGQFTMNPPQETEKVLGFTALKNGNCEVVTIDRTDLRTGETQRILSCKPDDPKPPHPYLSWSSEALAGLSYADPKAAEILGLRYIQSDEAEPEKLGLELLYRAVALSGSTEPLRRAIGARYAYVRINDVPQLENLKRLLMFCLISEKLGDFRMRSGAPEQELRTHGVSEDVLDGIHEAAMHNLQMMAYIQKRITGHTTIAQSLNDQ